MELTPKEHPSTQINMSKNDSGIGDTKSDFKTNVTDVTLNINDTQKEQISNSKIQNKPRKATIDNNEFVANSYFKSEPNVYKLPSDLNRGDLSKDYKEIQLADIKNDSRIALLTTESETKLQIIKIEIEKKSEFTEIHLYANTVIENYQKPDCNGKNMKIRIPGATDKISDLSKMNDTYPINKIGSEIIKNLLIYTVSFSVDLSNCTCKRNGPKELIFTAYHGPINESMNDKNSSDEKKNEVINFDNQKKKWELDVIVLDPGHGGHDVGAVGVSGIYEKDLTLKLAKKVKELIAEKMPNTKVILTREDDRFVELYKRGQIANQAGGKLFISIHLNAAQKKPSPARGVETYILRPGRNDDAIRVANFENSVIKFEKQQDVYKHLNEEQIIIATMAQSAFVQFSEKLAKHVQEEIVAITKLEDRGVKQAGFYVLVGASMPNILFEACFLSNPEDEKFVSSAEGQEKIALGLVKAIKKYSDEYMK
jgi:N-acetylmuramoyl-L-alanine amidase